MSWYPRVAFFSAVCFRGTLPQKRGEKGHLAGVLDGKELAGRVTQVVALLSSSLFAA